MALQNLMGDLALDSTAQLQADTLSALHDLISLLQSRNAPPPITGGNGAMLVDIASVSSTSSTPIIVSAQYAQNPDGSYLYTSPSEYYNNWACAASTIYNNIVI